MCCTRPASLSVWVLLSAPGDGGSNKPPSCFVCIYLPLVSATTEQWPTGKRKAIERRPPCVASSSSESIRSRYRFNLFLYKISTHVFDKENGRRRTTRRYFRICLPGGWSCGWSSIISQFYVIIYNHSILTDFLGVCAFCLAIVLSLLQITLAIVVNQKFYQFLLALRKFVE